MAEFNRRKKKVCMMCTKIVPRRVTGNCALHQRYIAKQVKRARAIALMPYTR